MRYLLLFLLLFPPIAEARLGPVIHGLDRTGVENISVDITASECTNGQVPKYDGSEWGCGTDNTSSGGGSIEVSDDGVKVVTADVLNATTGLTFTTTTDGEGRNIGVLSGDIATTTTPGLVSIDTSVPLTLRDDGGVSFTKGDATNDGYVQSESIVSIDVLTGVSLDATAAETISGAWDFTGMGDITFKTGATGGTLRTGTSAADKFQIQAYDVDGGSYTTVMQADAGNSPIMQLFTDFFHFEDSGDSTKIMDIDLSGATTSTTMTLNSSQSANRSVTLPNADVTIMGDDTAITAIDDASLEVNSATLRRAALTGDVTASAGSNTTAIAADVVSNDEIAPQAVSTDQIQAINKPTDGQVLSYKAADLQGEWVANSGGDSIQVASSDLTNINIVSGEGIQFTTDTGADPDRFVISQDIMSLTTITAVTGDFMAVVDASDGMRLKKVDAGDLTQGGSGSDTNSVKEFWWPASATLPLQASADSIAPISKNTMVSVDELTVNFDSSNPECRTINFKVPSDVDTTGTATFRVQWKSDVTNTGNVLWQANMTAGSGDGVSSDTTTAYAAAADAVGGVLGQTTVTTWTETVSNLGWTADEMVNGSFCRDANQTADTMSQDSLMVGAGVEIPRA